MQTLMTERNWLLGSKTPCTRRQNERRTLSLTTSFADVEESIMKHDGKDDKGKVRPTLLPIEGIEGMLEVMEYGAKKYCVGGWREVPNAEARYKDALLRHLFEELKQPGSKD